MWIFSLLLIIVFFFLSAFFSGIETGLISLDRLKMEQEAKNDKKKKQIKQFLDNPDRLFGTTLFGTNISTVIVTSIAIFLLKKNTFIQITDHAAILIIAGVLLIFAEIIPKAIYRDHPNKLVTQGFPALRLFSVLFFPLVRFVSFLNNTLAKLLKLPINSGFHLLTREDLSLMLAETQDDETLQEEQREMLEEALEFTQLDADNVMVHRTDIVAIEKNTPIAEVLEIARENGYTRFPVYEGDLDHIIGILIIYDLIKIDTGNGAVAGDFVREAFVSPETTDLDHLLAEMQANQKSMAIIVDSFGGTAGLVTIEDILEEIVGEIEDEYDIAFEDVEKIDENTYLVPGFMEIDLLNGEFELDLPEGDYETIAGLIIDKLEKIPRQGTQVTAGNWTFKVVLASDKKIERVQIQRNQIVLNQI